VGKYRDGGSRVYELTPLAEELVGMAFESILESPNVSYLRSTEIYHGDAAKRHWDRFRSFRNWCDLQTRALPVFITEEETRLQQFMPSRNPTELREELQSIDFSGDADLLAELRDEAQDTVSAQEQTLQDIDTKASKILRVNVLLLGILVSALSLAAQNGSADGSVSSSVAPFVNLYSKLGVTSLVLSTAFAGMTYTASELDVGLSSENLAAVLQADFAKEDVDELLVKNYIIRINFNRSTNIRNIPLIQTTILLVIAAVVLFTLGVYDAVVGSVPGSVLAGAVLLVVGVILIAGLPTQLWRALRDFQEWR